MNDQNKDLKNKPYTQQFCFMWGQNNTDKFKSFSVIFLFWKMKNVKGDGHFDIIYLNVYVVLL